MPIYTKESLETLRQRIDLVEVLSPHMELKRAGATYKGLCPFHDEKSPSFTFKTGDSHYHCFGCSTHGDAIHFLMNYLNMNFVDAVEHLAQQFNVILEKAEGQEERKGPSNTLIRKALDSASEFFQFNLLHTEAGHKALEYLYDRGLDLEFIQNFQLGWAPNIPGLFRKAMHKCGHSDEVLEAAALIAKSQSGKWRDFFYDRVTFPIRSPTGAVIAFSARKIREETFGGKYINSSETPLFKKAKTLFGLNYCRRRMAKERKAIIVEGQVDALRLIQAGLNLTVAPLGTAFTEGHVKEFLQLGVNRVYLAMDADEAGREAAAKMGDLFQREAVEVRVVQMPLGADPDTVLRDRGIEGFQKTLEGSVNYLTFLVEHYSRRLNMDSPAGKNELVQTLSKMIREWKDPVMVHESLRELAHLTRVPESLIGLDQTRSTNLYIKRSTTAGMHDVNPDLIMESDLLRWLILMGKNYPELLEQVEKNVEETAFTVPVCRQFFETFMRCKKEGKALDILTLSLEAKDEDERTFLHQTMEKKVNLERIDGQLEESIQRVLNRNWMQQREALKMQIQSGECSDDEALKLVKQFDDLQKNPPKIFWEVG